MDKMVCFLLGQKRDVFSVVSDPNFQGRGYRDQRWCDDPEKYTSTAPSSKDGALSVQPTRFVSDQYIQLVDLSAAQDIEAGDGTTSVVVLAGAFLGAAEKMLQKGIHPTIVAESFLRASVKAVEYLTELSTPVDLSDKASLLRAASTSLNSKVRAILSIAFLSLIRCPDRLPVLGNTRTHRRGSCLTSRYLHLLQRRSS